MKTSKNDKNTVSDSAHGQTANPEGSVVFLRGKKTILRPIAEKDIPYFVRWMNDPEIRVFMKTTFPITEQFEKEWYVNTARGSRTHNINVIFTIETLSGKIIGIMGIHDIDWISRVGMTGACIGEKNYQGKGYGTDAKMAILDYAFNSLNLEKICSTVYAFNQRSLAYSLHCGYKVEGCLIRQVFRRGRYYDVVKLGLFKKDWLPYWRKFKAQK